MGKQEYNYTLSLLNFSRNMKLERIKKGFTQQRLANLVGVTKQTILNYENRKTIPTSIVMESIAVALGTSLEKLFNDDDENSRRIRIATKIEQMDADPQLERSILEQELLEDLYELAKFRKAVIDKNLSDQELDNLIGGKLNKTTEEKIRFLIVEKESKLRDSFSNLEKFYQESSDSIN